MTAMRKRHGTLTQQPRRPLDTSTRFSLAKSVANLLFKTVSAEKNEIRKNLKFEKLELSN
jgi:hypothetical protein